MRRVFLMSSRGFASSTLKLASLPADDHPETIQTEDPCIGARRGDDGLGGGEATPRVRGGLLVRAEPVAGAVGAHANHHACIVDLPQIAAVELEERVGRVAGRRPGLDGLSQAGDLRRAWSRQSRVTSSSVCPGLGIFGPVHTFGCAFTSARYSASTSTSRTVWTKPSTPALKRSFASASAEVRLRCASTCMPLACASLMIAR